MKQTYLDKARSGRVLTVERVGQTPMPIDAPVVPPPEEVQAETVAQAPTAEAAWEALGERPKTKADLVREQRVQDLTDEIGKTNAAIKKGRSALEGRAEPLPASWVARFTELHLRRLALILKRDDAVFRYPTEEAKARRQAEFADVEVGLILGSLWPSEEVQSLMHALNAAGVERVEELCRDAVRVACAQRYGARDNTGGGA